jgi:hypothetical protein
MGYLILGALIIVMIDLPPLIKQKKIREITILSLLFLATITLVALYAMEIPLQSSIIAVGNFMKQMLNLNF